jgi:branched-chain amino acid transport system substrate-binding protein
VTAAFAILAPSPAAAQDDKTIRLGTTFLLTGKWAVYGLDNKAGMEIALDEINKEGVLGKKLQVLWEDTAGDKTVAVALLRKFAGDPSIPLIIQVSTAELGAQAPLAKSLGIPVISTGSVGAGVPLNEWTFRVNLPVSTAIPILVQGVKGKRGVRRLAVIYDMANEFPSSEAKLVEKFVNEDKSLQLVAVERFKTGDRDFSAQLTKLRNLPHDALWVSGTADEVGLIMRQAREMGIKSLFVGGTALVDPATFNISRGAMTGAILSLQFSPSDPRPIVKRFVADYDKRHGKSPPLYAALGYDVVLIVADAIKRAGKIERAAIREALAATRGLEGLAGRYTYQGQPDNQTPVFKLYEVTEKNEYRPL